MDKLINDNAINLIQKHSFDIRRAQDNKEFFALLKQKLHADVDKIFDATALEDKTKAIADVEVDLKPLIDSLWSKLGATVFDKIIEDRKKLIGEFDDRIVVHPKVAVTSGPTYKTAQSVAKFAEDNDYPKIIIEEKDGIILKSIGPGKDAWDNAIAWDSMAEPYRSNFRELTEAIVKYGTKKERL